MWTTGGFRSIPISNLYMGDFSCGADNTVMYLLKHTTGKHTLQHIEKVGFYRSIGSLTRFKHIIKWKYLEVAGSRLKMSRNNGLKIITSLGNPLFCQTGRVYSNCWWLNHQQFSAIQMWIYLHTHIYIYIFIKTKSSK